MNSTPIRFTSSLEAKRSISLALRNSVVENPLVPITFVVQNYRVGGQVVSQLNREAIGEGEISLSGVEQITAPDLLALLCDQVEMSWSYTEYSQKLAQHVSQKLFKDGEFGDAANLMPSTIMAITSAVSNFNWINLEDESIYVSLDNRNLTPTARRILSFSRDLQAKLNSSGNPTPARLVIDLQGKVSQLRVAGVRDILGRVFFLDSTLTNDFINLVSDIVGPDEVTHIEFSDTASTQSFKTLEYKSFPDVFTEVRFATKKVIDFLLEAKNPLDVAVLYSDAQDYLTTLTSALDDAGIEWYGPAKELASNARISLLARDVLEYASAPDDVSLDRKTVMRCIRSRILANPDEAPEDFSWHWVEKFVKNSGLFNDAEKWVPELRVLEDSLPELIREYEEALEFPDDTEFIEGVRRNLVNAYSAKALASFIQALIDFKRAVSGKKNTISEAEASNLFREFVLKLLGSKAEKGLPLLDSKAWLIIKEALSLGFGDPDENNQNHAKVILTKITESLLSKGAHKPGGGVFVGDLRQHPVTNFKFLVVIGCTEGALPSRILEDPLIPDFLRSSLPEGLAATLPSTFRALKMSRDTIISVISGAEHLALGYSRSGLVGSGSGKPSPLVKTITTAQEEVIPSFEEYVDFHENAVLESDLARKVNLSNPTPPTRILTPELESALSIYAGKFTNYFGNVGVNSQAYDFESSLLSPSSVEAYLKCPHKFLVSYGMGFYFEDDTDEIEDYRANDFGTMVHAAWEKLFEECKVLKTLPAYGQPFSESAKDRFRKLFEQEVQSAKNKGQAGWEPLFQERAQQFIENIDLYFQLEHEHRSMTPTNSFDEKDKKLPLKSEFMLQPQASEFSFDSDGAAPLRISVPNAAGRVTMSFKGRMDRLDLSTNRHIAGVIDFKTTNAKKIVDSVDEHIQDLIYGHAMRKNVTYGSIHIVTFHYLTMKAEEESKLVNLRPFPKELFVDESLGGATAEEIQELTDKYNSDLDGLLLSKLSSLARAVETGYFPPNPNSSSANYCEVCQKVGKSRAKQISFDAHAIIEESAT